MSPAQASRASARWLWPVVALVVATSVAGGLLAREYYHRPQDQTPRPVAVQPSVQQSVPRSEQPGDGAVKLSIDAAAHPDGEQVRAMLQRMFDAINSRQYAAWLAVVSARRSVPIAEEAWQSGYETTRDGTILVQRIETTGDSNLHVLLSFVSTQKPEKAPAEMPLPCLRWRVVYPMVFERGVLKFDPGVESKVPSYEGC
ncbi:hypothetical protein F0L68_07825 [Solihabitans fulvus]|uniref:Uncharacterized protein n=1 Tax=Solihabitans fulvus TaxID=1892852 RepID=A0A5B2XN21_9PSEU|nr:hypothetical protein [Solihabitans fulvus]KAA2264319.1 hypothetical protein F0L68_07825 [Solihabitans fulvus]